MSIEIIAVFILLSIASVFTLIQIIAGNTRHQLKNIIN